MGGWNNSKGKQRSSWWSTWEGAYRQQAKDKEKAKGKGSDKKKRAEREQRRREAEGQSFRVPGLRLCLLISIGFIIITEATDGGRGTQGSPQVPQGKWCRANRVPCRASQSRSRATKQPQQEQKTLNQRKNNLVNQKENETEEGGLGNFCKYHEGADHQAQRRHGSSREGTARDRTRTPRIFRQQKTKAWRCDRRSRSKCSHSEDNLGSHKHS